MTTANRHRSAGAVVEEGPTRTRRGLVALLWASKPRADGLEAFQRDVLGHSRMRDAYRAGRRPARFEREACIVTALGNLNSEVVVEVDCHAGPGPAVTITAVISAHHPDAGIVVVPH